MILRQGNSDQLPGHPLPVVNFPSPSGCPPLASQSPQGLIPLRGALIIALEEAEGSQCCSPVGGVGRILRTEVQIPPASGQFVFPPSGRGGNLAGAERSGAAEAKFGWAVAGPVADGQ